MHLLLQICDANDSFDLREFLQINDLKQDLRNGLEVVRGESLPPGYQGLVLRKEGSGLSLLSLQAPAASPTRVDFGSSKLQYRLDTSRRSGGLPKAAGLDKMSSPFIVDATAGLGTDAFVLAALGAQVLMLEKSPVMAALLRDGLDRGRAAGDAGLKNILGRLQLEARDAHDYFAALSGADQPDVVCLDPMFPSRRKSARVKKDMALMQELLTPNDDLELLLEAAMGCARKRVVVKRPGKAAKTANPRPDFQVPGKACHFQVFLTA